MKNIIEFYQEKNIHFWPRQQLLLKLFYKLEMTAQELVEMRTLLGNGQVPEHQGGNPYARIYVPGIAESTASLAALSDEVLQTRLYGHEAYCFLLVHGRRSGATTLNQLIAGYEAKRLQKDKSLAGDVLYGVCVDSQLTPAMNYIVTASGLKARVPVDERRHLVTFQMDSLQGMRGRRIASLHLDDVCHSADAGESALHVLGLAAKQFLNTHPSFLYTPAGKEYWLARAGFNHTTIVAQFATWEMNPSISRDSPLMKDAAFRMYGNNPLHSFENEFGGQWVEDVMRARLRNGLPKGKYARELLYA